MRLASLHAHLTAKTQNRQRRQAKHSLLLHAPVVYLSTPVDVGDLAVRPYCFVNHFTPISPLATIKS